MWALALVLSVADARARLVTAAALRWCVSPSSLTTSQSRVSAPDGRSALWLTLADHASHPEEHPRVSIRNRLTEILAQLDLLRAEIEAMRKEADDPERVSGPAGVASDADGL